MHVIAPLVTDWIWHSDVPIVTLTSFLIVPNPLPFICNDCPTEPDVTERLETVGVSAVFYSKFTSGYVTPLEITRTLTAPAGCCGVSHTISTEVTLRILHSTPSIVMLDLPSTNP